jgi:hypothetical protein
MAMKSILLRIAGLMILGLSTIGLVAQSSTTSALTGRITTDSSTALSGATLTLTHVPTGTSDVLVTKKSGRFSFTGLRPGGPYTLSVLANGYQTREYQGLQLNLSQELSLNVQMKSTDDIPVFELESFVVTAGDDDFILGSQQIGPSTSVSSAQLRQLPTVTRSLTDFTRLDPRISVYDRDSGAISAGGANTRYNSLLIDGVPTNDSFGLNPNGLPSLKQPFSLDAISEISVQLSPYSVEEAGFTGAAVRAVTKSGTNTLSGSVYGYYRNTEMVGDLYDLDGELVPFKDYTEYTAGFSVGGPIIKDKLFYFVNLERVSESIVQDQGDFIPNAEELDRIIQFSQQVYGFDPGSADAPPEAELIDDKILVKIDWHAFDKHRFNFRFNQTTSEEPRFPGFSADRSTSLSSSWYTQELTNRDYTAEMFSEWTSKLRTELLVSFRTYQSISADNSQLPDVTVQGVDDLDGIYTGSVSFGTDPNKQADELNVDTTVVRFKANYYEGNHTISFGVQMESYDNHNLFMADAYGSWRFSELSNYAPIDRASGQFLVEEAREENRADNYSVTFPAEGSDGSATFKLTTWSTYLMDRWEPNDRFSLVAGVRLDLPKVDQAPFEALGGPDGRSFEEIFGIVNTGTVDGNYVIQPRIGFSYSLGEEKKTKIRGGAGLFYGRAPHIWLSTAYVNNGSTQIPYYGSRTLDGTPAFNADPLSPPLTAPLERRTRVDLIDPEFKMPTEWKYSLAVDHELPWWDFVLTLEAQFSQTEYAIHYENLNLKRNQQGSAPDTLPDGRKKFQKNEASQREDGYGSVIMLTNTEEGESVAYTVELRRPMKNNWTARIGYTYTDADSVNDGAGNSGFSNWSANVAFDPNSEQLGTSRYQTAHRIVGSATYQLDWSEKHKTRISVVYDGRSGRPFSYLYGGNNFSNDLNNDGNFNNDLLYIPSDIDDPLVAWGNQNNRSRDVDGVVFMEYVERTPGLREYKGQVLPRNTGQSPWVHHVDLSIVHEITVWKGHKLEFTFSIQNLGNLIKDTWGIEKRPQAANNAVKIMKVTHRPFPRGDKGNENGFLIYQFDQNSITEKEMFETRTFGSRWAMQAGIRYSF